LLLGLQEREAQPAHARLLQPRVHATTTLRLVHRKVAQDRQPVGMLAGRLDGDLVAAGIPVRRMQDGGIHAGRVHFGEQLVLRIHGYRPMCGNSRRTIAPDVDLRIDDHRSRILDACSGAPIGS
jgi:hypothetical protein